MANKSMNKAKVAKNDEFYTKLSDIENELKNYRGQFRGKTVYCCCDDPRLSKFWAFFHLNFRAWGLTKLIATFYSTTEKPFKCIYLGGKDDDITKGLRCDLKGDGDFRSDECQEIFKDCDIVATNPPFSLYKEFLAQLMQYKKDFIILGNKNSLTYKPVLPLIRTGVLKLGFNNPPPKNLTHLAGHHVA